MKNPWKFHGLWSEAFEDVIGEPWIILVAYRCHNRSRDDYRIRESWIWLSSFHIHICIHPALALSVTFEQVCQGLDEVIANADSNTLSPCMRDSNCTMVQCQVTGITAMFIHQSALTFLPCEDPPSVRLQLWNPTMAVLIDQVFNETRTVTVNTGGGSLPLTVFISQPTDSEISIMVSTL